MSDGTDDPFDGESERDGRDDAERRADDADADPDVDEGADDVPLSGLADEVTGGRDPSGEPADDEEKHTFEGHEHVDSDHARERVEETPGETPDADDAPDEDAPLSDLANRLRERERKREGEPTEADELFEDMGVEEIDSGDVWDSVLAGEEFEDEPVEAESTPVDEEGIEFIVEKAQYCERCPYFADPPEAVCTHDDAAIVEVVDMEQFRVRNCPFAGGETAPNFEEHELDT